jgi:hypothetical protein
MTTQNYLMINQSTNVVDNVCIWDGNPDTWPPPAGYLLLVQDYTLALIWFWDKAIRDWVLAQQLGQGQIGFIWNGIECVTNEPKPAPLNEQPTTQDTQTL